MNKELFDKLDRISDKIFDMDVRVKHINEMLDQLIAALHNYDDGLEMFDHEPPNEALREAAEQYKAKVKPCAGHDAASWDEERMNIIGQNGNEGLHYTDVDENEFDDYGKRVDKDKSNNPAKRTGGKKKSAYDKHIKYPPHKH